MVAVVVDGGAKSFDLAVVVVAHGGSAWWRCMEVAVW